MSEFKGTKGKWIIQKDISEFESTITSENKRVCEVKSYDDLSFSINENLYTDPNKEEQKCNALLISKAPEMLELLIKIHDRINNAYDSEPETLKQLGIDDELFTEIEKTIKQATKL